MFPHGSLGERDLCLVFADNDERDSLYFERFFLLSFCLFFSFFIFLMRDEEREADIRERDRGNDGVGERRCQKT